MRRLHAAYLLLLLGLNACTPPPSTTGSQDLRAQFARKSDRLVAKIAFGSCAHQDKAQPILRTALAQRPDLFIYLGDNIYGDTRNMAKLRKKYGKLAEKEEFRALRAGTRVLATWDDHDYGENDAGRLYPFKAASKKIFLDFWEEPAESPRWKHPGIYHVEYFGPPEKRVQVILLDTRTFRDGLILNEDNTKKWLNDYQPNESPDSTFLGKLQWSWLEDQLREPAKLRIIASSNQFGHEYNGWESWTNVPHEREKMLRLIRRTKAEGVVFISGDVHWGELTRLNAEALYPIYDVTSSGITQTWNKIEPNKNRIGEAEPENNFGLITVDWNAEDPKVTMEVRTVDGKASVSHAVSLDALRFGDY